MTREKISSLDHAFASGSVFLKPGGIFSALKATRSLSEAILLQKVWRQFSANTLMGDKIRLSPNARLVNRSNTDSVRVGNESVVRGILRVETSGKLEIGAFCYIGDGVIISAASEVKIGAGTLIAHGAQIFDNDTHPVDPDQRITHFKKLLGHKPERQYEVASSPVSIGECCWIGLNSIVMKGVTIGTRSIVAAGSVVTKNMPENVLIAGNPAVVIKELKEK